MIVLYVSSTDKLKCVSCGKNTCNYIEYSRANGLGVKVPVCSSCNVGEGNKFLDNMEKIIDGRLTQLACDIKVEKEIALIQQ